VGYGIGRFNDGIPAAGKGQQGREKQENKPFDHKANLQKMADNCKRVQPIPIFCNFARQENRKEI
jgi:hypothetical protein